MKSIRAVAVMAISTIAALALFANGTWAGESRQYCEEMYPADSYEADERQQYINECIGDGITESTGDESEYYEGTVEDFVENLPGEGAQ